MEVITVLTGGAGFEDAAEYLPYVSALRRDRIARKRSGSDKLLSLTAGLLISLEVTRRTGIPRGSIRYVHGAFGKPYLDGSTLQFSRSARCSPTGNPARSAWILSGATGA